MKLQLSIWIFKEVIAMNLDEKHFEHLAKMKSLEGMSRWYSWDSPIGLSIFFLTLTFIVILVKWAFFPHVGI
jgi:hypothetical protein